jgi:hypothetical protein
MRLLILSESIQWTQSFGKAKFEPPNDVHLAVGNLNDADRFPYSVFDYDVAILHIHPSRYHSLGYFRNIPKVAVDTSTALEHGRSVICLPQSTNFRPERDREIGDPIYDWLKPFGVVLRSNTGSDIKSSGAGQAYVIQEYLKYTPAYHQIVIQPKAEPQRRLAVVDDTEILVGLEHPVGQGTLVILPPPSLGNNVYILAMSRLVDIARRYYERAQRRIPVGDAPDWVLGHLVPKAIELNRRIEEISQQRLRYDRISYVLYGTGGELEESVAQLSEDLGFTVERQPLGANIDLIANHSALGIGFALEVTGTKGIIRKDSNKLAQAWQYLNDRAGTPQENDKLVIIANTRYHLNPKERGDESFTPEVVKLLGSNEVLLMTTLQLYEQWKSVHEGQRSKEDVVTELHNMNGLYESK